MSAALENETEGKSLNDMPQSRKDTPSAQDLTTRVLDFLSTASNEQLSACALGLGVATYFILGRLGLILIGILAGIILHATWDGSNTKNDPLSTTQRRQKESSLAIVERLLSWQDTRTRNQEADIPLEESALSQESSFDDFQPQTAAAFNHIVERAVDDYVKWWYSPILPADASFPRTCRRILTSFLLKFSAHLSRKRPEDVLLNILTNSASIFIVFLGELSKALMAQTSAGKDPADAIVLYLTENPNSSFSNVLDRAEQEKKLKAISEDILQTFLDPIAYRCDPMRVFLKEVLAGLILEPTLVTCSKSHWINGWIVYLLEEGEPEIMNAINAGVGEATGKQVDPSPAKQAAPNTKTETKSLIMEQGDDEDREALEEVKRLNALIASGQLEQNEEMHDSIVSDHSVPGRELAESLSSAPSTNNILTPTSSESDLAGSRSQNSVYEESRNDQHVEGSQEPRPEPAPSTSFDQIVSQDQIFVEPVKPVPLTLYQAVVNIFDDSQPGDKSTMRSKPSIDYLLQVEPASSQHPGWMIARRYTDFESLHEILRRISVISGVPEFSNKFPNVPNWKGQTKQALTADLESYLREALSHARLAESVGMKKFLERDEGLEKLGNAKGGLNFPSPEAFQTMGKGMLDALANAPKGAAGGGKALLDGMKGVGGVFSNQKRNSARASQSVRTQSTSTLPVLSDIQTDEAESPSKLKQDMENSIASVEEPRSSNDSPQPPQLPARPSVGVPSSLEQSGSSLDEINHDSTNQELLANSWSEGTPSHHIPLEEEETLILPPRPEEIDFIGVQDASPSKHTTINQGASRPAEETMESPITSATATSPTHVNPRQQRPKQPLTGEETSVAVELIFAVINELYTLSSAWNIRRTLLNAAKTFLLRPGNPSLEQIRELLQESVIEANTSDAGIAHHLQKLRENSLPTEAELAQWPAPASEEENEKLRRKARKLLVEQGMPPALRGIMGAAASGEALGRLFDALQVEEAARGLMFAVMLQSIRALTH